MALGTTDGTDNTFAYAGKDRVLTCTSDELAYVRAHRHTGFGNQLNTVFRNGGYRRRINHFGIHRHLYGFEHITTGEVDRRGHLE